MNINNNNNITFNSNLIYKGADLPVYLKGKFESSPIIKKLLKDSQYDLLVLTEYVENQKIAHRAWGDSDFYKIALKWNKAYSFWERIFNENTAWLSKNFHDERDIMRILNSDVLSQRLSLLFKIKKSH